MKNKYFFKRIMMSILVIWAMYSTFGTISNIKANHDYRGIYEDQVLKINSQPIKSFHAITKKINTIKNKPLLISSAQQVNSTPLTLETAIDWSVYSTSTVVATGYTAFYESTGKNPGDSDFGITYSGVKVKRDLYSTIAADLNVFPIGTILFIPGYGYGVVADKGGAIKGNKIDLYYETVEDVYNQWGKKTIDVYVIKKGNGKLKDEDLEALNENESLQVFREQYVNLKK